MSDATMTAVVAPVVLLLAAFILNEIVRPWWQSRLKGDTNAPAPVVGEPVSIAPSEPLDRWAQAAYDGVLRELADEKADHLACHEIMRKNDLTIPPDHLIP